MTRTLTTAQAKARFSAAVRDAEDGHPILITRHGQPVAALVRAQDLEQLERLRAAGPEGGLASVAGGWKGSNELANLLQGYGRKGNRNLLIAEE